MSVLPFALAFLAGAFVALQIGSNARLLGGVFLIWKF